MTRIRKSTLCRMDECAEGLRLEQSQIAYCWIDTGAFSVVALENISAPRWVGPYTVVNSNTRLSKFWYVMLNNYWNLTPTIILYHTSSPLCKSWNPRFQSKRLSTALSLNPEMPRPSLHIKQVSYQLMMSGKVAHSNVTFNYCTKQVPKA